jgi:1,4-alpha-glucan branching enzyme
MASDVFTRVVYTENHDQVGHPPGQNRLPTLIDINDHESVFAKKRSTLAAAIMLTSPGIPMIFQGQEMLETRDFGFRTPTPVDFNRAADPKFRGIVQMYRDLIALRRNLAGKTGGLTGQNLNVFHLDDGNKTLAYHRWEHGGAGDDVVVVANFSNVPLPTLNIGFPRGGQWHVRFNSGAKVYDPSFENGDSFDTTATPGRQGWPELQCQRGRGTLQRRYSFTIGHLDEESPACGSAAPKGSSVSFDQSVTGITDFSSVCGYDQLQRIANAWVGRSK